MTERTVSRHDPGTRASTEPWLRQVFAQAAVGIALVDMNGRVVESNPALQRMIGYTAEELHDLTLDRFTHPDDLAADRDLLRDLLRGRRSAYEVESRYVRKDGETVWGQLTVSLLRNAAGEPEHAIAMVQDVTERKQAQDALATSEAKFRSLIENASDLVTVLHVDGTIAYESPSIERILGYAPEEIVGRSVFELVHPEDVKNISQIFSNALRNPATKLTYELRHRHRDGHWVVLDGVGVNLIHEPAVGGIVANSRDVTERRRMEQALERERAHLEQLFESSPEGVVLVDADDRILRVNPEFTRMFGYTAGEAVGRTIRDLIVPEEQEGEGRAITRRVAQGEMVKVDAVRKRKDGSLVEVSVMGAPIRVNDDQVAVYGIYQDISERRSLEQSLRRLSDTDMLTGLLNRRGFFSLADREWQLAHRRGQDVLLFYFDLDGFKEINDAYGHAEGDRLLEDVADLLRRSFRSTDVIARVGGDEFVVLAVEANADAESLIPARLDEAVREFNRARGHPYEMALSTGALRLEAGDTESIEVLLQEADQRMYHDKRARKRARG